MIHPFDLNGQDLDNLDLDFQEPVGDAEAAMVGGGTIVSLAILPEDGGGCIPAPYPKPYPYPYPYPKPYIGYPGPQITTLALGEEGGSNICLM